MKKIFLVLSSMLILVACTSKREKAIELNKLGIQKMNRNQFKEAILVFDKAIGADATFEIPYYNRGNMKYSLMDYQGALTDYNKAIELNPGFADAYYNRAELYRTLNQPEKACADWKKAKEFGRSNLQDKLRGCN
ncbi:MAG: tetratricopeptide repeat protein [Bacteroidota bacterium]